MLTIRLLRMPKQSPNIHYIVRVNGKDIEDTKTKNLIISLFLDPSTFDYLVGAGALPQDQAY